MLIGELSQKSGFTKDTIRYYEKLGLLKHPKKARRVNNYKEYTAETVERLRIIRRAKLLGFSLNEIHEFMDSWLHKTFSKEERIALFESRLALIDIRLKELEEIKELITKRVEEIRKETL